MQLSISNWTVDIVYINVKEMILVEKTFDKTAMLKSRNETEEIYADIL